VARYRLATFRERGEQLGIAIVPRFVWSGHREVSDRSSRCDQLLEWRSSAIRLPRDTEKSVRVVAPLESRSRDAGSIADVVCSEMQITPGA
jgi:hypothetical protein